MNNPVSHASPLSAAAGSGFSDLFKAFPELMGEALAIHNGIVRKARWSNFGCGRAGLAWAHAPDEMHPPSVCILRAAPC